MRTKKLFLILIFILTSLLAKTQTKIQTIHLSLEVGASAYSFMDSRGLHIDDRWHDIFVQKPDVPLVILNTSYLKHNLSLSVEEFGICYVCQYYETDATGHLTLPNAQEFLVGFLQARHFRSFSVNYGYELITLGNLSIIPYLGFYHRKSKEDNAFDGEYYVEEFIPHIGRPGSYITKYHYNHFDDWGPTAQLFVRYTILRHLTLSLKTDYIRFADSPKNQLGVGALIGFRW